MPSEVLDQGNRDSRDFGKSSVKPRNVTLLVLVALFPALVAFIVLYRQSPSVPYQDDYGAILDFAANYEQLPSWKGKLLDIATEQSNEYKLGFEHSIVALELEFTHRLNFGFLTALGNLLLLPIAYLLWLTYQIHETDAARRLLDFLPVSFLFFSLTYWENLDWAMTGLQNTPVVLFSLLAIYLLTRPVQPLFACVAAMLAAFSSANGFLLGPVGLLILLPRRAFAAAVVWCCTFVPPVVAYLYHYHSSASLIHRFSYLTRPLFFLAFLGCAIPFRWPAAILGLVLLAIFFLAVQQRFDRVNPAAFYSVVWILATTALVAWVRGAVGFYTASRYSIYSILLLIFSYGFLARYLPGRFPMFKKRYFYSVSAVLVLAAFLVSTAVAYQRLAARRRMILAGIEFYRARPEENSPMIDPQVEQTVPQEKANEQAILTRVIQKRIYALPPKQEIQ